MSPSNPSFPLEIIAVAGQRCGVHNIHAWTERTPEREKREVRATKFGKQWRIQSKIHGATEWTVHEPPLLDDLRELRDILFRKWQRRRASYEELCQIEQMLKDRELKEGDETAPEEATNGD